MEGTSLWTTTFVDSLNQLWYGVIGTAPKIIVAILVFIIGWLLATLLEHGVRQLVNALSVDSLLVHTGVDELVQKAGYKLNSARFIGVIVRWFFIILFFEIALNILNLVEVNVFLNQVLNYIPQVVIAIIMLFAGSILADFGAKLVRASGKATNVSGTTFMVNMTRWMIWVFTIILVLTELGIATQIIIPIVYGIVAMFAIAGGLAFGLGGKDVAHDVLRKLQNHDHK